MSIGKTRLLFLCGVWCVWMMGGCEAVLPCDAGTCVAPQSCVEGRCVCASPSVVCGGVCVDVKKDASHCGSCGKACGVGELCVGGVCAPNCPASQVGCGGQRVSLERDPLHCGGCGKACAASQPCVGGKCVWTCPPNQASCGELCVSLERDVQHCGSCGKGCDAAEACRSGVCDCMEPLLRCDGACVDVRADGRHCGGCGKACESGSVCSEGVCVSSCPQATSSVCVGGCVDVGTNVLHCGDCGKACAAGLSCIGGVCGCTGGRVLCEGRCVDVKTDRQHCGVCGQACGSGSVCSEGVCVVSCPQATSTVCLGGCVDVQTNGLHCGGCGKACKSGTLCVGGVCGCAGETVLCEGRCVDVKTNVLHCGGCGKACAAGLSCVDGKCPFVVDEVLIPAGTFVMGSPATEAGRSQDETQHEVTLTRSFWMGKFEVTQSEFQTQMGYNPSNFKACGGNCPVENTNWHEAAAYCNAASRAARLAECFTCTGSGADVICSVAAAYTGANYYNCRGYRLPTEAEWEYAYRTGTTTAFYNGDITHPSGCSPLDANADAIGWYCGNAMSKTHAVGGKLPNTWGLYDMTGNVWEWVHDLYGTYPTQAAIDPVGAATGTLRVNRGGSYNYDANAVRAAQRFGDTPTKRCGFVGFRVVRSSP